MINVKKLSLLGVFLFSGAVFAGGTITLHNKSGIPVEIFNKSNVQYEYESGGPILQNNETYRVVGPKASSYEFGVRTLDKSNYFLLRLEYVEKIGDLPYRAYELKNAGHNSTPASGICWHITKIDYEGPFGPQGYYLEIRNSPCF